MCDVFNPDNTDTIRRADFAPREIYPAERTKESVDSRLWNPVKFVDDKNDPLIFREGGEPLKKFTHRNVVGHLGVRQKGVQCLGKLLTAFSKDLPNLFADFFTQRIVKIGGCYVFVFLEVELYWKVVCSFGGKCLERILEKGGFTGLAWCEQDDVSSLLNASDEIGKFLTPRDNVIISGIDRTLRSKSPHVSLLLF